MLRKGCARISNNCSNCVAMCLVIRIQKVLFPSLIFHLSMYFSIQKDFFSCHAWEEIIGHKERTFFYHFDEIVRVGGGRRRVTSTTINSKHITFISNVFAKSLDFLLLTQKIAIFWLFLLNFNILYFKSFFK